MINSEVSQNAVKGHRLINRLKFIMFGNLVAKILAAASLFLGAFIWSVSGTVSKLLICILCFLIGFIIILKIYLSLVRVVNLKFLGNEMYVGIYNKTKRNNQWELISLYQFFNLSDTLPKAETIYIPVYPTVRRSVDCTINGILYPKITFIFNLNNTEKFIRDLANRDFREISDLVERMEDNLRARVDSFLKFLPTNDFSTIDEFANQLRICLIENGDELRHQDLHLAQIEVAYDCNAVTRIEAPLITTAEE